MDMKTYIRKIKTSLGSSVVDLELPDDEMTNIVNDTLDEIKPYITTTHYLTLPYQKVIDLSKYSIYNIYQVFRGEPNAATTSPASMINDEFGFGLGNANSIFLTGSATVGGQYYDMTDQLLTQVSMQGLAQSVRGLHNLDFQYKDNKLYVDSIGKMNKVTIEYTTDYKDVDSVDDRFWQLKLINLSKANTKIVLGRIRSKYELQGQTYSLDGQTLLNEGNQERAEILNSLTNSAFSLLQILD